MKLLGYRIIYFVFGLALLVVFAPMLFFGLNPVPVDSPSSYYYSEGVSPNKLIRELASINQDLRMGRLFGIGILGSFIGSLIVILSFSPWFHFLVGFIGVGNLQDRKKWLIFLLGTLALAMFLLYYTIEYRI